MLDEREITLQGQRRIGARAMKGGDEVSKPELAHGIPLQSSPPNHSSTGAAGSQKKPESYQPVGPGNHGPTG
ncbi:hypothetical protein MINTM008_29370 [Mycobacterium intracellulare]|nr:hypothetical protein MINTM001_27420 [Mycobacterium paraintracellulare]BCO73602.1 hypothetical protein MINTM008_29370 [Mycobacterium intracellulare]BCO79046.1 hypothetical protein MINTM009_28280 [Mycobacterium intracellulare]BCP10366.1 hypothetical protein MINTM020_24640 [Mycobacterium paraintracellulare]BCP26385.1 hypothetical protein MINTM025_27410 [Mycobacterium intracellulare]